MNYCAETLFFDWVLWALLTAAIVCAAALIFLDVRLWWTLRPLKKNQVAPPLLTPAEFRGLEEAVAKLHWSFRQRGIDPKVHRTCVDASVGLNVLRKNIAGADNTIHTEQQTNYGSY